VIFKDDRPLSNHGVFVIYEVQTPTALTIDLEVRISGCEKVYRLSKYPLNTRALTSEYEEGVVHDGARVCDELVDVLVLAVAGALLDGAQVRVLVHEAIQTRLVLLRAEPVQLLRLTGNNGRGEGRSNAKVRQRKT
jgi:hypothetical protein